MKKRVALDKLRARWRLWGSESSSYHFRSVLRFPILAQVGRGALVLLVAHVWSISSKHKVSTREIRCFFFFLSTCTNVFMVHPIFELFAQECQGNKTWVGCIFFPQLLRNRKEEFVTVILHELSHPTVSIWWLFRDHKYFVSVRTRDGERIGLRFM